MTDEEIAQNLAILQERQRRINSGIHELLNVLAILKGEVDLAVDRARKAVDEFYARYPDFLAHE